LIQVNQNNRTVAIGWLMYRYKVHQDVFRHRHERGHVALGHWKRPRI